MMTLREAVARLAAFVRDDALDRDFAEELEAHVDLATEEHVRRGLSEGEARRRALMELGGVEPSRQLHRESRGLPWLDGLLQDVRHAVRGLRRSPGFTLTAIATLAVAIGVNATVFTVTNAVLFKATPFIDRSDSVVYIDGPGINGQVSYPDFEDWRDNAASFEGMAAVSAIWTTLSDDSGPPEGCGTTLISAGGFELIGQHPILGRDFTASDEAAGAPRVAIVSHRLWERRYGKDPAIIGRTIRVGSWLDLPAFRNDTPVTVVGVMPPGFAFPLDQDIWMPLVPTAALRQRDVRSITFFFGRMAEGVTIESARAEIETIGRRLAGAYPESAGFAHADVQTFNEHFVGSRATTMFESMWGAVAFVLLIACANMANLMLGRAIGRSREMGLRVALGAGRWRIVRQLLVESLVLSALGGCAGWFLGGLGVRAYELSGFAPFPYSHPVDLAMDYRVLGYLVATSIGTGVLFGLAPVRRLSALDLAATLKDGGRGAAGGRRMGQLSGLLVAAQMALAVVLLTGAGAMTRSFLSVYGADIGVDTADVVTAAVNLPAARYPTAEARIGFYDRLVARLQTVPGVASVAIGSRLPASGSMPVPYELPGEATVDARLRPRVSALIVGAGYFHALGATVLSGREFTAVDGSSGAPAVIVNQRFASRQWPGEDPLGKRVRLFEDGVPAEWRTVVGVVSNIVQDDATRQAFEPLVYMPYRQAPPGYAHVFVRTRVAGNGIVPALRDESQTVDPDLAVSFAALDERLEGHYRDRGVLGVLFLAFGATALLMASIGLHAVIAHATSRRTQEIGVRVAMGAQARDILRLVLQQGLLPVAAGLAIGLLGAAAAMPVLAPVLVNVSPANPVIPAAAVVVLVAAAGCGCLLPARRATRVDPMEALRQE